MRKIHWQKKTVIRDFIYCPAWTQNPLAGVKFTPRDYERAVEFSRAVAKKMASELCGNDPEKIRKLAAMESILCDFNVAIVRATTPPFWSTEAAGGPANWHGDREQVYSRHCEPLRCWHIWDYLRRLADKLEGGRA